MLGKIGAVMTTGQKDENTSVTTQEWECSTTVTNWEWHNDPL